VLLVRSVMILLPMSIVIALILVSQGSVQTFRLRGRRALSSSRPLSARFPARRSACRPARSRRRRRI
jgi:hypothetical protein